MRPEVLLSDLYGSRGVEGVGVDRIWKKKRNLGFLGGMTSCGRGTSSAVATGPSR